MTESDAWQEMKPRLNVLGVATRIENSASTSVPDVIFMTDSLFIWIELKVDRGGYFIMPKYQYAYMHHIFRHVRNYQHWFAVRCDEQEGFKMMTAARVREMPTEAVGDKVKVIWKDAWPRMPSQFIINNVESCILWVESICRIHKAFG